MADTDERLGFESWCLTLGLDPPRDDRGGYRNTYTLMAWRGWAGKAGAPLEPWSDGSEDIAERMIPEALRTELAALRGLLAVDQISPAEFERRAAEARERFALAIAAA